MLILGLEKKETADYDEEYLHMFTVVFGKYQPGSSRLRAVI